MVKAIIFDCFGVLVNESWLQFLTDYAKTDEQYRLASSAQRAMDTGMIDESEFIDQIADITGLTGEEVTDYLFSPSRPNSEVFELIRQLKSRYRLAILSNISSHERLREVLTDEQIALFDALVLSGEVGMVKPDEQIYRLAADLLGCMPDECVFVDDIERFCDVARQTGMKVICYQNNRQLTADFYTQRVL